MAKIMVVDDEPHMVYIVKKYFEMAGHTIVEAPDGRTCLERLNSEKPDLVLLDIMMPGINGWEVCKKIKDDPSTTSILVAMFSVLSDPIDKERSLTHCGADEHFVKNIELSELTHRIEDMLVSRGTGNN